MTPEQFVYWLQGFMEMTDATFIDERQFKIIQDHLDLVLDKKTPNRKKDESTGNLICESLKDSDLAKDFSLSEFREHFTKLCSDMKKCKNIARIKKVGSIDHGTILPEDFYSSPPDSNFVGTADVNKEITSEELSKFKEDLNRTIPVSTIENVPTFLTC